MKKIAFLLAFIGILMVGNMAKAAASNAMPSGLFGLGDPNTQISYYDINSVWKYYCFVGQCYDITTDKLAFVKDVEPAITDLQNKVTDLQNQVTQLQNQPIQVNPSNVVVGGNAPATESLNNGAITCKNTYKAPSWVVTCSNTYSTLYANLISLTEQSFSVQNTTKDYSLTEILYPRTTNFQLRQDTHDNIGGGLSVTFILKDQSGNTVGTTTTFNISQDY